MSNNITTVRQHLLDTLADLRNREQPMDIDRARAVADVARVLVDSAKVEVDFIKATGTTDVNSEFLQPDQAEPGLPPGITGITRHRITG
ncbi:hypothetical protein A3203_32685 [Burkholderia cenocepacia]|uniref:hypothetical protein n=1 Tax=Burkholderia cenocepacia TaxID=95486 RepID=UPI00078EB962|nr:hypothetical protein [Burkholderia cenocepacia]AMU17534.1 hypothetical protein A3203_32685 [Burkholderia cenocepacia]